MKAPRYTSESTSHSSLPRWSQSPCGFEGQTLRIKQKHRVAKPQNLTKTETEIIFPSLKTKRNKKAGLHKQEFSKGQGTGWGKKASMNCG